MQKDSVNISRQRSQEMVTIQNRLASIQTRVKDSLNSFQSKKEEIKQKNQKYHKFLLGLNHRSITLQKYTEELLRNEHDLLVAKSNYEMQLASTVRKLRSDDKTLSSDLGKYRKLIMELCAKKTQLSSIVSTLSQTISTYEEQEINLDHLKERAEKVIARLTFNLNADPVSINNTEIDHINRLIAFADKETSITESHIEQYSSQFLNTKQLFSKYISKIEDLRKIKELTLRFIDNSKQLADTINKKTIILSQIKEKQNLLQTISKKVKKMSDDIKNHRIKECNSFVDSQRSMNHSMMIENTHFMIQQQISEIKEQLFELNSAKEANFIEEQRLEEQIYSFDKELANISETHSMIINELDFTVDKIEKMNTADLNADIEIENLLSNFKLLQKQIRSEVIENAALNAQLNESDVFSLTYDIDVSDAKEKVIKQTDLVQYQVDSVMKEIRQLKNDIDRCQLIKAGMEAQKEKMDSDIINKTNLIQQCKDLFGSDFKSNVTNNYTNRTLNDIFHSNEISRHINSRVQTETISKLQNLISKKRATIQHRKDNLSTQRNSVTEIMNSYYDSFPSNTETLKRSIKFAVMENPLADRIQTLHFLMDNLESIKGSFDTQLKLWGKLFDEENESLIIDDWQIDLNQLREKADDLLIFNQVFGHNL
ncbi:hypothetical protein TRFO_10990 [Tritrichomonas foetus]|uniref:Uncharacterized protein n=1 Tax=Tritrichomonas foetus TaxID=1144522 RepID=A0A1J4J5V8_9EUKA|nr:hypothetical protein TRFO_10990 [Tritrichomonas foetus]|eukprot:OHS94616.1 hypothetical protein TRFO_10990 [Tritrichomonas foetus]